MTAEYPKPFFKESTFGITNKILSTLLLILFAIGYYVITQVSRMDPLQVWAQKIFYYHVPSAWVSSLSYFLVMLFSIFYLKTKDMKWDFYGAAAAEVGTLFCSLVLITGPIWAAPIWGKAWSWEPRLTTTLVLFLIYIGYFFVRTFSMDERRAARLSAIVGIIAFIDVPIVYISIKFWTPEFQSHPQPAMGEQPSNVFWPFIYQLFLYAVLAWQMIAYRFHMYTVHSNLEKMRDGR